MIWTKEQEERDKEKGEDAEALTIKEVAKMTGDILGCLSFTYNTP